MGEVFKYPCRGEKKNPTKCLHRGILRVSCVPFSGFYSEIITHQQGIFYIVRTLNHSWCGCCCSDSSPVICNVIPSRLHPLNIFCSPSVMSNHICLVSFYMQVYLFKYMNCNNKSEYCKKGKVSILFLLCRS